jgi:LysM repeat protein
VDISDNLNLPNVFETGQSLYLFQKPQSPLADDTITTVAETYGITVGQLFQANPTTPLNDQNTQPAGQPPSNLLEIPGLANIGQTLDKTNYVPYAVQANEKLQGIAAKFGMQSLELATLNQQVPYLFEAGQSITVQNQSITTQAADSMQDLIGRFKTKHGLTVSLQELLDAIQDTPGLLAAKTFLASNLPRTPAGNGDNNTMAHLQTLFNVPVEIIAAANASLDGFLATSGSVTVQGQRLDLGQHDTFTSLVTRFKREKNVTTTVQEIAVANKAVAILAADKTFLLPPNNPTLGVSLGANYADNPRFPNILPFEVTVDFKMLRDKDNQGLFDPNFQNEASVKMAHSLIAPQSDPHNTGQLSLLNFAAKFETAMKNKVKVGLAKADGLSPDNKPARHIWAVYFGDAGIKQVNIQRDAPNYYAIKPLANTLVTRQGVMIQDYQNGLLSGGKKQDFKAVDMEVWAQEALEAIDLFLSAPYVVPAYELSAADYERVVNAKKTLAKAISGRLDYILDVTRNETRLTSARETLKEQLLVNLSKAYVTDAVLQYDVAVEASLGNQPLAPRFNGKPVNRVYTTGQTDSIATLADALHVSQLYVGATLQYQSRILNTGLAVQYNDQPYTIQAGDTLQSLLTHYNIDMQQLIDGLTWNNLDDKGQPQGLFAPAVEINITPVGKQVGSLTFEKLAFYFDKSVDELALANQDAPNIFQPGKQVPYKDKPPVTVTAENNTLQRIANAFNDPQITPQAVAEYNRQATGLLNAGFTAYVLELMPDFSITTGKLSLENSVSELNFMLNVKSEAEYRHLLLAPNYVINQMEYQIANVPGATGYQASDWLTFIIPIGSRRNSQDVFDTSLGQPEVPLPLRSYPTVPTIVSQSEQPTTPDGSLPQTYPQNVEKAKEWTFAFTYQHQEAEQDTNYINAFFNVSPGVGQTSNPSPNNAAVVVADDANPDLFDYMAQFISVWPDLSKDLATLLSAGGDSTRQTNAIKTFADLVTNIANHWGYVHDTVSGGQVQAEHEFDYNLRFTIAEGEVDGHEMPLYHTLILQTDQTPVSPNGRFPNVYWIDDSVTPPQAHQLSADPQGQECIYTYEESVPAFRAIRHRIEFEGLDIMSYQNALGGAYVKRNANLVEIPTQDYFVFQTPEVVYNQVLVPYLRHDQVITFRSKRLNIQPQANLQQALTNLFTNLLGQATPQIKIAGMYGYQLVAQAAGEGHSDKEIVSLLPIVYRPVVQFNSNLAANLNTAVTRWESGQSISRQGGRYVFDLCVFSTFNPAITRPLLELKNLNFYLDETEEF